MVVENEGWLVVTGRTRTVCSLILYPDVQVGVLEVSGLALPQHKVSYIYTDLTELSSTCSYHLFLPPAPSNCS